MEQLTTSDLFLASYLVSSGEEIKDILIRRSGRQEAAIFVFKGGEKLMQLEKNFENGRATIELLQFKASLTHVKDVMFHALRKEAFRHIQESRIQIL